MFNFYYIAKNTFRESLREPIFFLLLVSALVLIGLFPSMSLFVFREQIKLVIDSAMATTMVFGLAAAVLCASHTVSREMRNGTALVLLSKPVSKWTFILAKIAGITAALTVFVFVCNTATLISVRVANDQFQLDYRAMLFYFGVILISGFAGAIKNYFHHTSFASIASTALFFLMPVLALVIHFMPHQNEMIPLRLDIIPALILIFYSVWAMGTITVVFSTRLEMVANMVVCSLIFISGLVSNYFIGQYTEHNLICKLFYAIIPNWQFFWMADALASNQTIPFSYIILAGVYIVLYMIFCSIWAMFIFMNKEINQA